MFSLRFARGVLFGVGLCLAGLSLGCGGGAHLGISQEIKGEVLFLSVHAEAGAKVTVGNQTLTSPHAGEHSFGISLSQFKPGRNELVVVVDDDGAVEKETVSFVVPAGIGAPFMVLRGCVDNIGASYNSAKVSGVFGRVNSCAANRAGNYVIAANVNHNATLTVAGKPVEVGKDGDVKISISASDELLNLIPGGQSIRKPKTDSPAASDAAKPAPAAGRFLSPVTLAVAGDTLSGDLMVQLDVVAITSRLLDAFQPGKPLHASMPRQPPLAAGQTAFVAYRIDKRFSMSSEGVPLRALRVIGEGKQLKPTKAADCGPYTESITGLGAGRTTSRVDIDIDVIAYDAVTGKEMARRTFSAKEAECPAVATSTNGALDTIEMLPSEAAIFGWLQSLPADSR